MKKILFIANIAGKRGVDSFSKASVFAAHSLEFDFHLAANYKNVSQKQRASDEAEYGVTIHHIDFYRNPFHIGNCKAYTELIELLRSEQFDCIHCNTPIGGLLGRLAGRKCKVKKVIYQVHGFHFYKGAPLKNWLFYYPVERWLARYTDIIITINNEDYERAQKFKLRNHGKACYIPGVGIDTSQYHNDRQCRLEKRRELGLHENDIALISMGDLIERKNYPVAIEAIAKVGKPHLHYYICGQGAIEEKLVTFTKELHMERQVHFLGYRPDIKELLQAADIYLFTTLQEGLSRSLMEAMASGLPCIVSNIRGNIDLIEDGKGGYLVPVDDTNGFAETIRILADNPDVRMKMAKVNRDKVKQFDVRNVKREIQAIYEKI